MNKILEDEWIISEPVMKEDRNILFQLAEELRIPVFELTRKHMDMESYTHICYFKSRPEEMHMGHIDSIIVGTVSSILERFGTSVYSYSEIVTMMRKELLLLKQTK